MYNYMTHEQKTLTTSTIETLIVPTGGVIQSLGLTFLTSAGAIVTEAQVRAEITNIRLAINGDDIVNTTPAILLDAFESAGNLVENNTSVAGTIELNVGRLFMKNQTLRDQLGYGTADVTNIEVQITVGTLSAISSVVCNSKRSPVNQNLGVHTRLISYKQNFNATGDDIVSTLPRNRNSAYLGVLVNPGASGVISHNKIDTNFTTIRQKTNVNTNKLFISEVGYQQPAGYFNVLFADGTLSGKLDMEGVTQLQSTTTFTTAPGAGGYSLVALTLHSPSPKTAASA